MSVLLLLINASGGISQRDKNIAIGASAGAFSGAVLTGGSAAGTIGAAIVGGVIGNQVDKDKKY